MPKINDEYDIGKAFAAIENELIASMIRNMRRHKVEEIKEDKQWSMWQAEQLKSLEKYKKENQEKYSQQFKNINAKIEELIRVAIDEGEMDQENSILNAIKNGFKAKRVAKGAAAEFFKLNERKLEALLNATVSDMEKAETAVLRMANDQYRKAIFNAQVYANSGAGTYEKAVDMATKDMLSAGLNCVEYKNGARHTLSDYADMAIRTASKRAYLQGEGEKRQEWGIHTVIVNKRGNPCPKCLPFVGKVLIDDVWSGGKERDGPYPLMSTAIEAGLYHPRCKDSHTTYFPGISSEDDTWTKEELKAIEQASKAEAEQQYASRQAERFRRLAKYSLDPDNKKEYRKKEGQWSKRAKADPLTLEEESAVIRYISPDSYILNDKLRRNAEKELTDLERRWMENLDHALAKLPKYEGDLNRSLMFSFEEDAEKFFDGIKVDQEYIPGQYLSTTKAGIYNEEGQVQIYIQNAKNGKDLRGLNDMENEVLYPRDAKFRIVNKTKNDGKYYILLEEVE